MKGVCYDIKTGFVGEISNEYGNKEKMEFPTEEEYYEYLREQESENKLTT